MRYKTKRLGFTLLELLTVMAILSIVSTLGVKAFLDMSGLWNDTTAGMELADKCVDIFGSIRNDVDRVASAQRTGRSVNGIDRLETAPEKLIRRHNPHDDSVILPILQRNRGTGPWEQLSVMYSIERGEGAPKLVRTVGPPDGSTPAAGKMVVCEQVIAMNISYLGNGKAWEDSWSKPDLPTVIRVSISVGRPNRPSEHVTREAIFPIHVK
jgi:prepilin-type N-terminal cleavage/methylation domain-containing protein